MKPYICQHCGKSFSSRSSNRKFCSRYCETERRRIHPVVINPKCQLCGTVFIPTRINQKFCSRLCSDNSKRITIEKPCAYCGKIMSNIPKIIKKQKYCSYTCMNRAKVKNPQRFEPIHCKFCNKQFVPSPATQIYCSYECKCMGIAVKKINCQFCQKEFKPIKKTTKYCSRKCSAKALKSVPLIIFKCQQCGKDILDYPGTNRKYCSRKCHGLASMAFKKGERNIRWNGGKRPSYRGPNWKEQSTQSRIRDNYTCQICGHHQVSPLLIVHHIKAYRDFNGDYESANNLSNLTTLCRNCHSKLEGRSAKGIKGWIQLPPTDITRRILGYQSYRRRFPYYQPAFPLSSKDPLCAQ